MRQRVTDDHLRATHHFTHLYTNIHTHTHAQLFQVKSFSLYSERYTLVAKCPFDVCSASWENIASRMCHHQRRQQERSPEVKVMERERFASL